MSNIFMAPCVGETPKQNFTSTILNGKDPSFFKEYLSSDDLSVLEGTSEVRVWGTQESLSPQWDKINPGDYLLFYTETRLFTHSARVLFTTRNSELGEALWPQNQNNSTYPCIIFLDSLQRVVIPYQTIKDLTGTGREWVQGFSIVNDRGIDSIRDEYLSIETFLNQSSEEDLYFDRDGDIGTDGQYEIQDTTKLLRDANNFEPSADQYKVVTSTRRVRNDNKAQKERIAKIENYTCQVCGWRVSRTNSKGEEGFIIQIDHIFDKAKGGTEDAKNLWALCPNCHAMKTYGVLTIDPIERIVRINGERRDVRVDHPNEPLT